MQLSSKENVCKFIQTRRPRMGTKISQHTYTNTPTPTHKHLYTLTHTHTHILEREIEACFFC